MRDTRDLQNGAIVFAEHDGIRIRVDIPYAEHHQNGGENLVPRQIVPSKGLGPRWENGIALARSGSPPRLP
jgi:hypothetical protein